MKTITIPEKRILDNIVGGKPIPHTKEAIASVVRLKSIGLLKEEVGGMTKPVKGETYNYAGNTYTI